MFEDKRCKDVEYKMVSAKVSFQEVAVERRKEDYFYCR
jgi:hypothetical protein